MPWWNPFSWNTQPEAEARGGDLAPGFRDDALWTRSVAETRREQSLSPLEALDLFYAGYEPKSADAALDEADIRDQNNSLARGWLNEMEADDCNEPEWDSADSNAYQRELEQIDAAGTHAAPDNDLEIEEDQERHELDWEDVNIVRAMDADAEETGADTDTEIDGDQADVREQNDILYRGWLAEMEAEGRAAAAERDIAQAAEAGASIDEPPF